MNTHLFRTQRPASLRRHLFTGAVYAISLCGAAIAGERQPEAAHSPGRQRFHAKIAGTCTNKDDFSFTGTTAGLFPGGALRVHCVVAGDSTYGRYTAQILAEEEVTANACVQQGATGLEANVTAFVLVLSLNATQEQLFLTLRSGTQCLTPPGTVAGGHAKLDVIGGTGRFEGATGTLVSIISPIALAFSALGGDGFLSAFSGTLDGRIDLK